jgi:hypothetical protein
LVANSFSTLSEFDCKFTPDSEPPVTAPIVPIIIALANYLDNPDMGQTPDQAEILRVPFILHGGKQTLQTVATVDTGATSQYMDDDFAQAHGFPIYPLQTPATIYTVDGREATTLTHYTSAYIDIGGHRFKVLFHLMTTKPRLKILLRA